MTDPEPHEIRDFANQPDDATIDDIKRQADDALFEATRDRSSMSARRVLAQVFERELDEIATPAGSAYFSEKKASSAEREEKNRQEIQLLGAVGARVRDALKEHGIRVKNIDADPDSITETGYDYILTADDSSGREYCARFGLELAQSLAGSGGTTNLVERMGQAVSREVLREREKWFKRAGLL